MVSYLGKLRSMRTVRLLAECFQEFEAVARRDIRRMGLTPPQFDVIATLGNTPGLNFRQLGESTLITKGTLTGVVERLERDGLVRRTPGKHDRRTAIVSLTVRGEEMFERHFLPHVAMIDAAFKGFSNQDFDATQGNLQRIRDRFRAMHSRRGALLAEESDQT